MPIQSRASVSPYGDQYGTITGAITLHGWQGWIPDLQSQGDEFQRLGEVGAGSQITGKRGTKKTCTAWVGFTDKATAISFVQRWESLNFRIARVIDGFDRNLPRVRLTNCSASLVATRGPIFSGTTPVTHRVDVSADYERLPNA